MSGPAVTIVVIGAKGCGKSLVIRKGLRGHELSEPSSFSGSSTQGASLNCTMISSGTWWDLC